MFYFSKLYMNVFYKIYIFLQLGFVRLGSTSSLSLEPDKFILRQEFLYLADFTTIRVLKNIIITCVYMLIIG